MKLGDFIMLVNKSVVAFAPIWLGLFKVGYMCNLSLDHISLIGNPVSWQHCLNRIVADKVKHQN